MMLSQYHCLLSDRMAAQMKWSRVVNTAGRKGKNVSCDLHLEHLNRQLKGLITGLNMKTLFIPAMLLTEQHDQSACYNTSVETLKN